MPIYAVAITETASASDAPTTTGMIVSPVAATIEIGGPGSGDIADTLNHHGLLPGNDYTSGVTDFTTYIGTNPQHTWVFLGNEWFSEFGTTAAQVTYDLGSIMVIDALALWNEDDAGIGTLDLLSSSDNISFVSLASGLKPTDWPYRTNYGPDVFSFAPTSLRYVRFVMSDCPQPNGSGYIACAIGEVAFRTAVGPRGVTEVAYATDSVSFSGSTVSDTIAENTNLNDVVSTGDQAVSSVTETAAALDAVGTTFVASTLLWMSIGGDAQDSIYVN